MKHDEFKRKACQFCHTMINGYFPAENGVINKVANSMCKYILKNKINMIDPYLCMFSKEDGEIDIHELIAYMQDDMIGENGLKFNMHDYFQMLPDRTLTIHKEDLNSFLI